MYYFYFHHSIPQEVTPRDFFVFLSQESARVAETQQNVLLEVLGYCRVNFLLSLYITGVSITAQFMALNRYVISVLGRYQQKMVVDWILEKTYRIYRILKLMAGNFSFGTGNVYTFYLHIYIYNMCTYYMYMYM